MTYESFLDLLEEEIRGSLKKGEKLKRVRVLKNNGFYLDGFSIWMEDRREQPTVYVNHLYREAISREELRTEAGRLLAAQRQSRSLPADVMSILGDYGQMRSRIYGKLISRDRNQELLKEVPHREWLDLALVFYLRIPEEIIADATALIHRTHLGCWGTTEEELYQAAMGNMRREPADLLPLEQFLGERPLPASGGMYLLSNRRKEYGAALIADPQVQRMCAKKLGGDYYVLPSSIHELILLPAGEPGEREALDQLVREVNHQCVSREEYLSDHAYQYDSGAQTLTF